jgi:hypothetical protein
MIEHLVPIYTLTASLLAEPLRGPESPLEGRKEISVTAEERGISGVALVTGGARGIGFEVGRRLAQRGMTVSLARAIPEGAASVVWAAALPDDGPTGGFFRDGEPLPW